MATTDWLTTELQRLGYEEPSIEANEKLVTVTATYDGNRYTATTSTVGKGDWPKVIVNMMRLQKPNARNR